MGKRQSKLTRGVCTSLQEGALAKVSTEERIRLVREEIESRGLIPRLFTDVTNVNGLIAHEETFKRTLLMYAYIMTGDHSLRRNMVQSLLDYGADPFECDTAGRTFLHYVVRHKIFMRECGFQVMYVILDKEYSARKIDTPDTEGMTVFHEAFKQLATSKIVLENTGDNMNTAVVWAEWRKLLDALISVGADVNTKNHAGNTCLHTLFKYRERQHSLSDLMLNIIRYLLEKQIDITLTDRSGMTAYQKVEKPVRTKVQLALLFSKPGPRSLCVKADGSVIFGDILSFDKQKIKLVTESEIHELLDPVVTYFQLGVNPENIPDKQQRVFWEILISCLLRVRRIVPFILKTLSFYGLRCHLTLDHIKRCTTYGHVNLETILQVYDDVCTYSQQYIYSLQVLAARVVRLGLYPNALAGVNQLTLPHALKNFIVPEKLGLVF